MTLDEIRGAGFQLADIRQPLLPLRLVIASRVGEDSFIEVRQYFARDELGSRSTLQDLIEEGGFMLSQRPTSGHTAEQVVSEVGDRATLIAVGPLAAAVVWGDPRSAAARRPYSVYWSDGTYDFSLYAGLTDADEAVGIARSIYCF
jgi:hypothetical protein